MRETLRPAALLLTLALGARVTGGGAQVTTTSPSLAPDHPSVLVPRPPFQLQRAEEDWRGWEGAGGLTDQLKDLPLGGGARLALGADVRLFLERFAWEDFGLGTPPHDTYVMQRVMLHGDLRLGPRFPARREAAGGTDVASGGRLAPRVFAQLRSGVVHGRRGEPRPADTDTLGVHQLFVEVAREHAGGRAPSVAVRVGRQEFYYGTARLVHVREGPNVRHSFDALRLILRGSAGRASARALSWRADLLAGSVAPTGAGLLDEGPDRSRQLWGVYASVRAPHGAAGVATLDGYYLGHARDRATFAQGTGAERRHTVGVRLAGTRTLGAATVGWDWEPMLQWGRFAPRPEGTTDPGSAPAPGRIRAWTVATETRWQWGRAPLAPLIAVRADIASGDRDPRDRDLQTFHPLYPRGNYFGQFAPVGPANFIDLHPRVELSPRDMVTFTAEWLAFWRQSTRDGTYDPVGGLLLAPRDASGAFARGRLVGYQPALALAWTTDRHTTVTVLGGAFLPGRFVRETSPGRRIGYAGAAVALRF
jgi:hypothetical protein